MKKLIRSEFKDLQDGNVISLSGMRWIVRQIDYEKGSLLTVPMPDQEIHAKINRKGIRLENKSPDSVFLVEAPEERISTVQMIAFVLVVGVLLWIGIFKYPGTFFLGFLALCLGCFTVSDTRFGKYFGLTN